MGAGVAVDALLPPLVGKATGSRTAARVFALFAKLAGVDLPSATWTPLREPTFENGLGEIVLACRTATATIRRSPREGEDPELLVADPPFTLGGESHDERLEAATTR